MPLVSPAPHDAPAQAGRAPSPSAGHPRPSTRHLVQRPVTPEEFFLGTTVRGEYRYVLSDTLPGAGHQPAEGHRNRIDGLGFVSDALYDVARFVALRQLGLSRRTAPRVTETSVDITEEGPWRPAGRRAYAVTDLVFRAPERDRAGGPLECTATVGVDGVPCATARARLDFPGPAPAGSSPADFPGSARGPEPLAPHRVGRSDPRDVVLTGPVRAGHDRLTVGVAPRLGGPRRAGDAPLLAASCQAAVLAAAELRGFSPAHCLPVHWSASLHRPPAPGVALHCLAVPGAVERDGRDRPVLKVRLSFAQDGSALGSGCVTVVQDW
ncbi:hypothetical protein GCM10009716_14930 [Streptomyces sodiiphilus]|uniref:A-factor biosynthesis hotdog domain-containing protein n=1 Tax=Streptomyces sodiiphilus TaxID=226217 RepID=A0ABN2NZ33_9ACTN